ncbi:hypothetical protein SCHPADRAFT_510501 [Schizopora paradoxa]|uniref:Uncharacterized protein n=1 Tax=Schizopora paradoxa TaxID=27342 RepID=A0A0H2RMA9_9AGAM|nr:hypothetical protein SCHPADRAFT_510501 [Schizopora paradoxa]
MLSLFAKQSMRMFMPANQLVYFEDASQDIASSAELNTCSTQPSILREVLQTSSRRDAAVAQKDLLEFDEPPGIPVKEGDQPQTLCQNQPQIQGFSSARTLSSFSSGVWNLEADLQKAYKGGQDFCPSFPSWSVSSPPTTTFSSSLSPPPFYSQHPPTVVAPSSAGALSSLLAGLPQRHPTLAWGGGTERALRVAIRSRANAGSPVARFVDRYHPIREPSR